MLLQTTKVQLHEVYKVNYLMHSTKVGYRLAAVSIKDSRLAS